ncbi:MAG: hypothetical protein LAN18_01090 [Acidobacteriia bacterium]|nr:hypothetical protein [Terriglobia bacterium]
MGVTKKIAMLQAILLATVLAIALLASGAPGRDPSRKIPCKTAEIAAKCYWTHGRLSVYNGTPSWRLWKIGTHHILGIHSGSGAERIDPLDNEHPEFPANLERAFKTPYDWIFAAFEVCPLEPEKAGVMQRVCIESAKNIVVGQ